MVRSMCVDSIIRTFQSRVFWSIVITFFLFSCSQNPLSVDERQPEVSAQVQQPATDGPVHSVRVPPVWNGDLVVYAHGFVPPGAPLDIPAEAQQFGAMAMSAGYAFATTSYPSNGMAIVDGLADLVQLVGQFKVDYPQTGRVFLIGASMGGLIAAQAAERHPETFSGVLAMCGIYGSYIVETAHVANTRVVFDYFFPNMIPGDAVNVPLDVMLQWESTFIPLIAATLSSPLNADKLRQLLAVTKIPVDVSNPPSAIAAVIEVLSMQIFATEDVKARLGGNPFGNRFFWYSGSDNDRALNAGVRRYQADQTAVVAAATLFGTTGNLRMPVVTMHNTGDNLVTIVQQLLYRIKILFARKTSLYTGIPVTGFGHCGFTEQQILTAFGTLVFKVTGTMPQMAPSNASAAPFCSSCK